MVARLSNWVKPKAFFTGHNIPTLKLCLEQLRSSPGPQRPLPLTHNTAGFGINRKLSGVGH